MQNSLYAQSVDAELWRLTTRPGDYGWDADSAWAQREYFEAVANETRLRRFRKQWAILSRLGFIDRADGTR